MSKRQWTDEQLQTIYWFALPKTLREPKTQKALAQRLNVNLNTITSWKQIPELWDEVEKLRRSRLNEHLSDIYEKMIQQAKAGSHHQQKMILDVVKETYVQNADSADSKKKAEELSIEEAADKMFQIISNYQEKNKLTKDQFVSMFVPGAHANA